MKTNVIYVDFSNKCTLTKNKTIIQILKNKISNILLFLKITILELYKEGKK